MNWQAPMARIARWHLLFGLLFAALGVCLGLFMAMSQNHVQRPTHAHTLLLGFVISLLYAVVYRLWLADSPARTALVQTALHEVGTIVLVIALFLMFAGSVPEATIGPLAGVGALLVLAGVLVMAYQVARLGQPARMPMIAPGPV